MILTLTLTQAKFHRPATRMIPARSKAWLSSRDSLLLNFISTCWGWGGREGRRGEEGLAVNKAARQTRPGPRRRTLRTMILIRSSSVCLRLSSAHDRTACAFLGLRGSYLAGSCSPVACGRGGWWVVWWVVGGVWCVVGGGWGNGGG